jgi:hypothetical protein
MDAARRRSCASLSAFMTFPRSRTIAILSSMKKAARNTIHRIDPGGVVACAFAIQKDRFGGAA